MLNFSASKYLSKLNIKQTLKNLSFYNIRNTKLLHKDKSISTLKWEYEIINTKLSDAQIDFINRVPISKNANIVVKTLLNPQPTSTNTEGKLNMKYQKELKRLISNKTHYNIKDNINLY